MTGLYDRLQDVVDGMDIDTEAENLQFEEMSTQDQGESGVDVETREITWVKPFDPGEDQVGDETRSLVLEDGSQLVVAVKKRVKCPSCSHVLSDGDEPDQLSGECSECDVETCHRCQNECAACGAILCDECSNGHGLKDETYCSEHREDVEEDIEFERDLEERDLDHEHRMEELEHELKEKEKEKKLELQEEREKREQVRQDYRTVIDIVRDLKEIRDTDEESKTVDPSGEGGGKPFGGTNAFSGEPSSFGNSSNSQEDDDSTPDWFKDTEKQHKETNEATQQ